MQLLWPEPIGTLARRSGCCSSWQPGSCPTRRDCWRGLARAALANLKGQRVGGSTITQQLVKNLMGSGEKTLLRKLRELLLSLAFEKRFSKDQILEMYLNEIPYGSTIYGVGAAAESYYRKPGSELTLAEEAKAQATPLQAPVVPIQAPHFVMLVKEQLEARYGRRLLEEGGFRVITTLDYGKQQAAEQAVREGFERWGGRLGFSNAALVAVQPGSGQVLAMVGSRNYFDPRIAGMVNVAVSPRQPGSSIKPIIYTEAFELGYTPSTILWDVRTTFGEGEEEYIPEDYDHEERGPMSMRQALQGSINIPAVKTLYLVGVSRALAFARSLGYDSFGDPSRLGLSFALGAGEVSLLEHVNAYATLAAEGSYHASVTMLRVEDAQGVVLEQWRPSPTRQALTANAARMITDVLADNEARTPFYGSHSLLQLGSRPVAAKTGTTTDNRDAWTIGYTPSLAAGVWVGNSDHAPMKEDATGTTAAAPIWNAFMRRALSGAPVESFTPPEIPLTGKPVLDGELEGEAAWAEGTGDGAEEGTARAHGLARRPAGPYTLASLARAAAPPRP